MICIKWQVIAKCFCFSQNAGRTPCVSRFKHENQTCFAIQGNRHGQTGFVHATLTSPNVTRIGIRGIALHRFRYYVSHYNRPKQTLFLLFILFRNEQLVCLFCRSLPVDNCVQPLNHGYRMLILPDISAEVYADRTLLHPVINKFKHLKV